MKEHEKTTDAEGVALTGLLYGGCDDVPHAVATCPECGGLLSACSIEWETETGRPTCGGLQIDCTDDPGYEHRYWQSDWQDIVDAVEKWCGAVAV